MALQLSPDEPEAGWWHAELVTDVAAILLELGRGRGAEHRPVAVAVDGRSSSGKTTLAARLRDGVAGSAVVHTDDIAWWHSRFGWADLLIDGVLIPARAGHHSTFALFEAAKMIFTRWYLRGVRDTPGVWALTWEIATCAPWCVIWDRKSGNIDGLTVHLV